MISMVPTKGMMEARVGTETTGTRNIPNGNILLTHIPNASVKNAAVHLSYYLIISNGQGGTF